MLNKVMLIGHLGKDPEIRKTRDGRSIASFSVATSESWKDKTTGERKQHTDWHNVVIFNEQLADLAGKHLKKGSKVYLEGSNKTRKWTDDKGVDRYPTEVVLQGFNCALKFLDKAERAPEPQPGDYGNGDTRDPGGTPSTAPAGGRRDDMDDEIPF
jgi:single-strand DNA-binding protein